jgi:hypothetical protein
MTFTNHLKKLNKSNDGGTKPGYYYLLCSYVLNYLFNRPVLANLRPKNNYRQQKKLFYTVVTGNYDHLNEISKPLPNWDYVCFTDNPELQSRSWRIELLTNEFDLDSVRLSRYYKINNHLVDSDYYLSVYVDCNMRIRGNLDNFVSQALPAGKTLGVMLHPFHSSLAEEVEDCRMTGKDDETLLREQYRYYIEKKGFDDKYPHINARLMIRRSKDAGIQELMETWFSQLLRWSRRDQVAFNYSLGQCPDVKPHYIPYWVLRRYFKKSDHC